MRNIETASEARFYDDLTGKDVPPELVYAARDEEIRYYKGAKVYVKMNPEGGSEEVRDAADTGAGG